MEFLNKVKDFGVYKVILISGVVIYTFPIIVTYGPWIVMGYQVYKNSYDLKESLAVGNFIFSKTIEVIKSL